MKLAFATVVGALVILLVHSASPQMVPLTLDQILQRLEGNLSHYGANVPGLFCDEHVVSKIEPSQRSVDTITDSTFRLKRILQPNHITMLNESRDIKTIDGRPAAGDDIRGPAILHGAFSGGLAVVSISDQDCMRYKLRPQQHPRDPYIVEFSSLFGHNHPSDCLLQEEGSGRELIDPVTMQVKRMELTAPNHTMVSPKTPNGYTAPPVNGVWTISIDYAPVPLGGQMFWMPTTIASNFSAVNGNHATWSFKAQYSNYHKLEVKSRIVPDATEQ